MADESYADDGGIFHFWEWIARQRTTRNLDDVAEVLKAVAQFDNEDAP